MDGDIAFSQDSNEQ